MNEWKSKCLALLGGMNSQRDVKEQLQVYSLVLDFIGEEFSLRAVQHAVLHEDWRPSPAKLRQIAARIAAPYPTAEDAYSEIMDKAQNVGLYGRPDPNNRNVLLEGPPPMSHPIVSRIVPYLGGWQMLCTGEAQMQEGLKKQVSSSHITVSAQWEEEVCEQLALPPSHRNSVYFRRYDPYRAIAPVMEFETLKLLPARIFEDWDLKAIPPPAPIREMMDCIRHKSEMAILSEPGTKWFMPEEGASGNGRPGLSREERALIQAETERIANMPAPSTEEVDALLSDIRRRKGVA